MTRLNNKRGSFSSSFSSACSFASLRKEKKGFCNGAIAVRIEATRRGAKPASFIHSVYRPCPVRHAHLIVIQSITIFARVCFTVGPIAGHQFPPLFALFFVWDQSQLMLAWRPHSTAQIKIDLLKETINWGRQLKGTLNMVFNHIVEIIIRRGGHPICNSRYLQLIIQWVI